MSGDWREALEPLGTDWRKPYLETAPALVAVKGDGAPPRSLVGAALGVVTPFLTQAVFDRALFGNPGGPGADARDLWYSALDADEDSAVDAIRRHHDLVIVQPRGQNPTGAFMTWERAEELGGRSEIRSGPDGWQVRAWIPAS